MLALSQLVCFGVYVNARLGTFERRRDSGCLQSTEEVRQCNSSRSGRRFVSGKIAVDLVFFCLCVTAAAAVAVLIMSSLASRRLACLSYRTYSTGWVLLLNSRRSTLSIRPLCSFVEKVKPGTAL